MSVHNRIFDAVFPPASDVDVPTPAATPVLGSSVISESFGSPQVSQTTPGSGALEQIKWDRCWHIATTFLSLADEPIKVEQSEETLQRQWVKPYTTEVHKALEHVMPGMLGGLGLGGLPRKDDLLQWYLDEAILGHYTKHVIISSREVSIRTCTYHEVLTDHF